MVVGFLDEDVRERVLHAVSTVLSNMVTVLVEQPSTRLLKHIVRCYLRLSDNQGAGSRLSVHLVVGASG